ncbi:N-acetyltransferase [Paenibacillus sp. HN-1]|uniref:GNAT family N-acetyltransferase n=1 Tax=Paenibacillus TaxID=44249 RepID=UPI001CA9E358|nr:MULTISPECIES: GNAT family N-acetyltransferase [Paenibacillus]MBY9080163.1 N-acetyltransferase [Paenibacillus sp. CGMCC 1.18879]MBY9087763.1 N-acetyltransferase [Paenibacillus sinensis]
MDNRETEEIGIIYKERNAFVIRTEEGPIGEITYIPKDEHTWVADHTYVAPNYRGGNIAQRLLKRLADEARAEGAKIIPQCSYVGVQFRRNPEYEDVWKH